MSISRTRLATLERRTAPAPVPTRTAVDQPLHIIDFVTNPAFLGKPLFPRQATVLKLLALDRHNLTAYDYFVIDEWARGFEVTATSDQATWAGQSGTPGDILERLDWNIAQGRQYFHQVELLLGRRGSKNYLAGLFMAWVVWQLISREDPHQRYGIDPTKRLTGLVFAGKKDHAIRNQVRDLAQLIESAPAFAPFHPIASNDGVVLFTPAQIAAGVDTRDRRRAAIEIKASETTTMGGRGPASFMLGFDEFAFVQGAGSTANSVDLFEGAYPSTTQFQGNAPVIQTTSPWDKQGQAWETYKQAMAVDPITGTSKNPDVLVLQLESWDLYREHDIAGLTEMWPGGPTFANDLKPIITFDRVLEAKQAANPESFAVEYLSQWRSSLFAYLSPQFVDRIFAAYKGEKLTMQTEGRLAVVYKAHGDPSLSQANFGFAIAHIELDDQGLPHIVFDLIHHWSPSSFPEGVVDYIHIENEIFKYIKAFNIETVTFDQWNSAGVQQRLQTRADEAGLARRCHVDVRVATAASNWEVYEVFKTAIGHNIVHAPEYPLARAELEALLAVNGRVDHPDLGDTRTKDVADAMAHTVFNLIGNDASDLFDRLARTKLHAMPLAMAATPTAADHDQAIFDGLSSFGRGRGTRGATPRSRRPRGGGGRPNWGNRPND